jgi:hypothetical protein
MSIAHVSRLRISSIGKDGEVRGDFCAAGDGLTMWHYRIFKKVTLDKK